MPQSLAYQYGLLAPLDWGEDCDAELRRATMLWNRLVEIERENRERVRAIAAADPLVQSLEARLAEAQSKKTKDRGILAALKDARKAAYAAHKPELREIEIARREAVKKARQESGCWWGQYNATIDSYETARRVGGDLHFRRHDGSGRLTNQIQGGMRVEELEGMHSQVWLGHAPGHVTNKRARSLTVTIMSAGSAASRRTVTWPIIMHRPLPEDARIQYVTINRRKRADYWVWSASFTVRIADVPVAETGDPVVVVNLGWRKTPDGIRVATVLYESGGEAEHAMLPDRLIVAVERCEQARARMDNGTNVTLQWLRQLDWSDAPEPLRAAARELIAKPPVNVRAGHLVRLLRLWRAETTHWRGEWFREFERWAHDNRIIWVVDAHTRAWITQARRRHYEAQVVRLFAGAGMVVLNAHDMSETAVAESEAPAPARHQRVVAAPSEFRNVLLNYTRRESIPVKIMSLSHDTCVACGAQLIIKNRAKLHWGCLNCHAVFDQDDHYCALMLQRLQDPEAAAEAVVDAGTKRRVRPGTSRSAVRHRREPPAPTA